MKIKLRTFYYIVFFLTMTVAPLFSFNNAQHDEYMLQVLFGRHTSIDKESNEVKALEYASYLTLDQFNGKGVKELAFLNQMKVRNIPKDISKIDFSSNGLHRSYTHRGWDFSYSTDKAHWNIRKNILIATANKVFEFKDSQQCNSFCALIYYVHVLGDHIADKSKKKSELKIDFAGRVDNNDIVHELTMHLSILFKDQTNSLPLTTLLQKMRALDRNVETLVRRPGGIAAFTDVEFHTYKNAATELMNLLIRYVPELLQKEAFFTRFFARARKSA